MNYIDICFASDDNYAPFMGVALLSALKSAAETDFLRFHILDNGISEENKKAIASLKTLYPNHEICFYSLEPQWLKDLPLVHETLSTVTYARLWLGRILPEQVSRVIYLDCDVFVRGSLRDLFNQDLNGCVCGGVLDVGVMMEAQNGQHPWPWRTDQYINAGVLVIDLARWREENTEKILLDYLYHPEYPLQFEDQDVINFALRGCIKLLEPTWNGQVSWNRVGWHKWPGIKRLRQTLRTCIIVHFASPAKPWIAFSGCCLHIRQYRRMMKNSPWKNKRLSLSRTKIARSFLKYIWVHPACLIKPGFYIGLYQEGVCLFR